MGEDVWFVHHDGEQRGPVSWSEVQEMAARGEIEPEDLLWEPSLPSWEPAGSMEGLRFGAGVGEARPAPASPSVVPGESGEDTVPVFLRPAASLVAAIGRLLGADMLDRIDRGLGWVGHISYACAAVLAAILLVVAGIRGPSVSLIVLAVFAVPTALMLGYSAAKLLTVMRVRLESTPTILRGGAVPDGLASLAVGSGAAGFALGLSTTVMGAGFVPLVAGTSVFLVLLYTAGASLDPRALNIRDRGDDDSGSESVAVVESLAKLVWLRLLPISYALAAATGALTVLWLLIGSFGDNALPAWAVVSICIRVLAVAIIPAVAWLGFQIAWMLLDVARSITDAQGVDRAMQARK